MVGFAALDVETANSFMGSICQIGIVIFNEGVEIGSYSWLINPNDYFDEMNVSIHGIDETSVADAIDFESLYPMLAEALNGAIVVHHTHFDRVSIAQACARLGFPTFNCLWLDTAKVARRTWPDVAKRGYGLSDLAARLGISFRHHDAEQDARAAGLILVRAINESGVSLPEWFDRVERPIGIVGRDAIRREAGSEGPLYGENVVFTGRLLMPRRDAADLAQALGASVEDTLTKRTTLLVVGDQDLQKLAGHDKSSKHRKAEALAAEGHPIRIVAERDFLAIASA